MKIISVLSLVLIVGVLGLGVFFVTNNNNATRVSSKATTAVSYVGTVKTQKRTSCIQSYYVGCYKLLTLNGKTYDLVEGSRSVNLETFVNRKVVVNGQLSEIGSKNLLVVSSINLSP